MKFLAEFPERYLYWEKLFANMLETAHAPFTDDQMGDPGDVLSNQTQFGEEEPLLEKTSIPVERRRDEVAAPTKKFWQQKKFLIVAGLGVFVVLSALLMFAKPPQQARQLVTDTVEASPRPERSDLQQRIDEVQKDLENADPIKVDLPYPPIETVIYIDKPQRL